ncbi:MAG: hypothetical protein JXB06_00840 [Spirochaetales bacterium]|nr:hypothetical protein [Spirochaetales bacterium]
MAKSSIPEKYQRWIDARKRYNLSHTHIQMARELSLNPKKFDGLANTKQEPWKFLLPEYIEELYIKHFGRNRPDNVRSIEQIVWDYHSKTPPRSRQPPGPRVLDAGGNLSSDGSEGHTDVAIRDG